MPRELFRFITARNLQDYGLQLRRAGSPNQSEQQNFSDCLKREKLTKNKMHCTGQEPVSTKFGHDRV